MLDFDDIKNNDFKNITIKVCKEDLMGLHNIINYIKNSKDYVNDQHYWDMNTDAISLCNIYKQIENYFEKEITIEKDYEEFEKHIDIKV
jgi:hypothetical protein